MSSELWKNKNYLLDIPYVIAHHIYEYDIQKANINVLYELNLIDSDYYDRLCKMDRMSRQVEIGYLLKYNEGLSDKLSAGIELYRKKLFYSNNIEDMEMKQNQKQKFVDGQNVKYAGIITSIKKKYTKNNKIMAFITVEDLYGTCEVIVFESCYNNCSNLLLEESIVAIDGRISLKEDADVSIIANSIVDIDSNYMNSSNVANTIEHDLASIPKRKKLTMDITNLDEVNKEKLRGAIRFFTGDRNNTPVFVKQGEKLSSCGAIFADDEILQEFAEIVGKENVSYD